VPLLNCLLQTTPQTFPSLISVLGCVWQPSSLATYVLTFLFMFLQSPAPFLAAINSQNHVPGTITNIQHLQFRPNAESFLQNCHSIYFLSLQLKCNVPGLNQEVGACTYSNLGDPGSIVYAKPFNCPALSMVLIAGPTPHHVDFWCLQSPSCLTIDKPNYFYSIPVPVRRFSWNHISSSLHTSNNVIEVLELFHYKLSNSRKPYYHFNQVQTV